MSAARIVAQPHQGEEDFGIKLLLSPALWILVQQASYSFQSVQPFAYWLPI